MTAQASREQLAAEFARFNLGVRAAREEYQAGKTTPGSVRCHGCEQRRTTHGSGLCRRCRR